MKTWQTKLTKRADCESTAVLVLSTRRTSNKPMVINLDGKISLVMKCGINVIQEWSIMILVFIMGMT